MLLPEFSVYKYDSGVPSGGHYENLVWADGNVAWRVSPDPSKPTWIAGQGDCRQVVEIADRIKIDGLGSLRGDDRRWLVACRELSESNHRRVVTVRDQYTHKYVHAEWNELLSPAHVCSFKHMQESFRKFIVAWYMTKFWICSVFPAQIPQPQDEKSYCPEGFDMMSHPSQW